MHDEDIKIYIPRATPPEITADDSSEVKIYPSVEARQPEHLP